MNLYYFSGGHWRRILNINPGATFQELLEIRRFKMKQAKCKAEYLRIGKKKPRIHPLDIQANRINTRLEKLLRQGDEETAPKYARLIQKLEKTHGYLNRLRA